VGSTARDRLVAVTNLKQVWSDYWPRVRTSTPGIDGVTPKQFDDNLIRYIRLIRSEVQEGYSYSSLRGVRAPKKDPSKFRIICVPTIQDRVVQRALLQVIETRAQRLGIANDVSFGFVKDTETTKRGTSAARAAAIRHRQNKPWVFKTDIAAFFDKIQRRQLLTELNRAFSLTSLMPLIEAAIGCEVDESNPQVKRVLRQNGIVRGIGLRQGMPLSPILSNFVLRDFDRAFTDAGHDLVRYADDLVVMASSHKECEEIEAFTKLQLAKLGLDISETKTETCAPEQPVEFLGMELGLKPGTTRYALTISDAQMVRVKEGFTELHDIDFAIKENLNLPKLLNRLENMRSGYRAAYGIADNFADFNSYLDLWSDNCVIKLYSSIFGYSKVSDLTPRQRRFLLLPEKDKVYS